MVELADNDVAVGDLTVDDALNATVVDGLLDDLSDSAPLDIDSMGMNSTALLNSWTMAARSRQSGCPLSMASCPLSMMRCPFCRV